MSLSAVPVCSEPRVRDHLLAAARHAAAGVSALEAFRLWSAPARGGVRTGWPDLTGPTHASWPHPYRIPYCVYRHGIAIGNADR